jgi:hypothetical protein
VPHPVPGGYKYGDLALQVGRVSRIGAIKYGPESRGTALASTSSNSKLYTRPLVREDYIITNHKITNRQLSKENFEEKEKLVAGQDGCLTPRRTGRLIVGRKLTSTTTMYMFFIHLTSSIWKVYRIYRYVDMKGVV